MPYINIIIIYGIIYGLNLYNIEEKKDKVRLMSHRSD